MPALRATSLRHVRPVVPLCAALHQVLGRIVGKQHAKEPKSKHRKK